MIGMLRFLTVATLSVALLVACKEETRCDTAAYNSPEITLVNPPGPVIEAVRESELEFTFTVKAEAGLNTFSMNGEPIQVFLDGQTEATFRFKRYFWEGIQLDFILHDLCNKSSILTVDLVVTNQPPGSLSQR
ncbi:MAG: hypothetical protein V2B15_03110 [Bacteroidota bacterium]